MDAGSGGLSPGLARLIDQSEAIVAASSGSDGVEPADQPWADAKAESSRRIAARAEASAGRNASAGGASAGGGAAAGTVLILSPMRDRAHALGRFFDMITKLTYPKHLISVGILEGDSKDSTFATAQASLNTLLDVHGFRRATLIKRDYAFHVDRAHRHDYHVQQERRSTLSRLRNFLFVSALYDEDWVLWIDSDLAWYPSDMIEVMMATNKQMVVPHCLLGFNTYDYNSWQETRESWALQATMQPEELLYEGYLEEAGVDTQRLHMTELQYRCEDEDEGGGGVGHSGGGGGGGGHSSGDQSMCKEDGLVKLDGVGGAVILMRSALHREGLYFPPYPFNHSIETEGLAKMSSEMEAQPYGMPMLKVWHK
jgi:hypothetical protein